MTKTIREIALAWKTDKQRYVKQSTYAAYVLSLENHILPTFGECNSLTEELVQDFVLKKLNEGLSSKTIKDILIVLNGNEVWSEEPVDKLLRMGHQVPHKRD